MRRTHDEPTISPEARAYLRRYRASGFGPFPLTSAVARLVRGRRAAMLKPIIAEILRERIEAVEHRTVAGVPVALLVPKRRRARGERAIGFYIHGGAYVFGEAIDPTGTLMADALGVPVWSLEYRLAPEHPFPAALDDALAVYRALVADHAPRGLVAFGVSAGGSLLASMLLRARDAGLPLPAATALFTPWSDVAHVGDSFASNDGRDPVITWRNQLDRAARAYVHGANPRSPDISPLYGDFGRGFPPTMITTGTRDLFLSHCTRLDRALRDAGVQTELRVWEGMWHSFQSAPAIPEAAACRDEVARYLGDALDTSA